MIDLCRNICEKLRAVSEIRIPHLWQSNLTLDLVSNGAVVSSQSQHETGRAWIRNIQAGEALITTCGTYRMLQQLDVTADIRAICCLYTVLRQLPRYTSKL